MPPYASVGLPRRENRYLYLVFLTSTVLLLVTLFGLQSSPSTRVAVNITQLDDAQTTHVPKQDTTQHDTPVVLEGDVLFEDKDPEKPEMAETTDRIPFTPETKPTYPFCPRCGAGDTICREFGDLVLRRSVAYEGTSRRLQEKLVAAMEGNPTKFAIMGGSVSTGRTLKDMNETFHSRTFDWWNKQFPHSGNSIVSGAKPATQSSYFAFCYAEHIPLDVDVILLEFSVNDGSPFPNPEGAGDSGAIQAMDWLVRSLLRLPSKPAVIIISLYSFKAGEYFNGQESHLPVVNYYDIPYISMKNALYDYANRHPEDIRPVLYNDGHHLSAEGHRVAAELIVHHIQRQICALDRGEIRTDEMTLSPGRFPLETDTDLPMVDIWTKRTGIKNFREFQPRCYTFATTASVSATGVAAYRPSVMQGWKFWDWKKEKYYIIASVPGSLITFPIRVTQGRVFMTIFKSAMYELGDVWCWADSDKAAGTKVAGYWDSVHNIGMTVPLFEGLPEGQHDVSCEVLGSDRSSHPNNGTNFRILAIVSG
ncbi:hypothetical protein BC938DRAFT_472391 [Jimgerdemannia flammicorona]|uniref:SGNH hydrolase-type esterase domain-containing protein n=1 Tax=Jimgerdemannia flammicorona TaxID=994334 RepID=A0A433Q674_9FUNG|nr:hypothetical protein BC938DRAFT_472391 [Jimgerdemannia flammicorona]